MERCSFIFLVITILLLLSSCSSNIDKQEQKTDVIATSVAETTDSIFNEDNSIIYETAIENINNHNLSRAKELFTYIGNYEDAETYIDLIEFITNIHGDYYFVRAGDSKYTFQITDKSVKVSNPQISYTAKYDTLSFTTDDEYGFKLVAKDGYGIYVFVEKDGAVYYRSIGDTYTNTEYFDETEYSRLYHYENGYAEPKEPEIGMTADEVKNSTWGDPTKINKTATKYGVHEQWVYSPGRYIYLDDGIVTSIQD